MNIEIINVGTELLLGEIVNTNATLLQQMCKDLGFNVYHQSVVGDNPTRFLECLDIAFKRGADCIITTGGLGPTSDDVTKELSAEFLHLDLIYHEQEAQKVKEKCQFVTGLEMIPENNFKQAYFPKNCIILENEVGTANGCVMKNEHQMIINLPGPPKEMKYVMEHSLIPYLRQYQQARIYTFDFVTMGIGESTLAEKLDNVIEKQEEVSIALYASEESVRVRIACKAKNKISADEKMAPVKELILAHLKDYLLSENDCEKALSQILPPFSVHYTSDFKFRDTYLLAQSIENGELHLTVGKKLHPLGEIIQVQFEYQNQTDAFEIPLLKKAEYSYAKLEAKITARCYNFLTHTAK